MKRFLTILLILVLVLSLASCGLFGKKSDKKDQTPTDAQAGQTEEKGDEPKADDPTLPDAEQGNTDGETPDGDKTGEGSGSQGSGGLHIGDAQGDDIGGSELEPDMKTDDGLNIETDDSGKQWSEIITGTPTGNNP